MRKELIKKLKKKDREEMLSRIKHETSKKFPWFGLVYINIFIKYLLYVFIAIPLWFIAFESRHIELLMAGTSMFLVIAKIIVYIVLFGFLVDYVFIFVRQLRISRIKREYFEVSPKRK